MSKKRQVKALRKSTDELFSQRETLPEDKKKRQLKGKEKENQTKLKGDKLEGDRKIKPSIDKPTGHEPEETKEVSMDEETKKAFASINKKLEELERQSSQSQPEKQQSTNPDILQEIRQLRDTVDNLKTEMPGVAEKKISEWQRRQNEEKERQKRQEQEQDRQKKFDQAVEKMEKTSRELYEFCQMNPDDPKCKNFLDKVTQAVKASTEEKKGEETEGEKEQAPEKQAPQQPQPPQTKSPEQMSVEEKMKVIASQALPEMDAEGKRRKAMSDAEQAERDRKVRELMNTLNISAVDAYRQLRSHPDDWEVVKREAAKDMKLKEKIESCDLGNPEACMEADKLLRPKGLSIFKLSGKKRKEWQPVDESLRPKSQF